MKKVAIKQMLSRISRTGFYISFAVLFLAVMTYGLEYTMNGSTRSDSIVEIAGTILFIFCGLSVVTKLASEMIKVE